MDNRTQIALPLASRDMTALRASSMKEARTATNRRVDFGIDQPFCYKTGENRVYLLVPAPLPHPEKLP
jgi:hypothetical protein